jgi:hypothetical protein
MAFGAIFVPNFTVQSVLRSEPELGVCPLVLIDGPPPTYRVVALNHLAALLGVTEGMTKAAATQFRVAGCSLVVFATRRKYRV